MLQRNLIVLLFLLVFAACCAAAEPNSGKQYTAYNIWYKSSEIPCINFQVGAMLPAGTEVKDTEIITSPDEKDGSDPYIYFRAVNIDKKFNVYCHPKYHPKRTIQDYRKLMFTHKSFEELTQGMSEIEIDAIKKGIIVRE
jgi:hypothetical protein